MSVPSIVHDTPLVNRLQDLRRDAMNAETALAALRLIGRLSNVVIDLSVRLEQAEKRLAEVEATR